MEEVVKREVSRLFMGCLASSPFRISRMKVDRGLDSISCRHVVSVGYVRGRQAS